MTGIDAVTYDPPIWAMFERKKFWEAHRVMLTREYYHLENLSNLDQLPAVGFDSESLSDQVGQHNRGAGSSRGDSGGEVTSAGMNDSGQDNPM